MMLGYLVGPFYEDLLILTQVPHGLLSGQAADGLGPRRPQRLRLARFGRGLRPRVDRPPSVALVRRLPPVPRRHSGMSSSSFPRCVNTSKLRNYVDVLLITSTYRTIIVLLQQF